MAKVKDFVATPIRQRQILNLGTGVILDYWKITEDGVMTKVEAKMERSQYFKVIVVAPELLDIFKDQHEINSRRKFQLEPLPRNPQVAILVEVDRSDNQLQDG